jgi:hypothetical protein
MRTAGLLESSLTSNAVFRKMLYGGLKESKPTNPNNFWVVHLIRDSPFPMKVIMAIIHARFELVPNDVDLDSFFTMPKAADKYYMVRMLRPWMSGWIGRYEESTEFFGVESMLSVVWILGHEHLEYCKTEESNWLGRGGQQNVNRYWQKVMWIWSAMFCCDAVLLTRLRQKKPVWISCLRIVVELSVTRRRRLKSSWTPTIRNRDGDALTFPRCLGA